MNLSPYEVYQIYLALKQHFSKDNYDFIQYNGKVRTSISAYNKRNDRYFFEKLSRKYNKQGIIEYFVSSFVNAPDPSSLWIGDLRQNGDASYLLWQSRIQSLPYRFQEDIKSVTKDIHLYECIKFDDGKHPAIIKAFLRGDVGLETLFILDDILHFMQENDYDPILKTINFKIKKYKSFFSYDKSYFIGLIRDILFNK